MKELKKLQAVLLGAAMFLTLFSYAGPAHAVIPTIDGSCAPGDNTNVCGPFTAVVGHVIVVAVEILSSSSTTVHVLSVTDGGDTFVQRAFQVVTAPADFANPYPAKVEIWSATHISGASVTVTILLTGGTVNYDVQAASIANILAAPVATATGSCIVDPGTCGILTTSSSNAFSPGNSIAIGALGGWGLSTITAGTGFTALGCVAAQACLEYSTSVASPTSYPITCASCGSSNKVASDLVGAVFSLVGAGAFTCTITNMDAGNYLVVASQKAYDFKCTVESNAINPTNSMIDDVRIQFNDSVHIITLEYGNSSGFTGFRIGNGSSYVALGGSAVSSISGGVRKMIVDFEVTLSLNIVDATKRGIQLFALNDNFQTRGFEYVQKNYFNILNQGGGVTQLSSGLCSVPAGADLFQTICQYQASPKSWIAQNSTWYKLQGFQGQFAIKLANNYGNPDATLFQDYPNSGAGAENSTNAGDWKINFGLYYYDNTTWVKGINCVISMLKGDQGTVDEWTQMNVQWYNGNTFVENATSGPVIGWIEQNPLSQMSLWINLWYSNNNASTSEGGRVAAYYTGMHNSGYLWWSSWSPLVQNNTQSTAYLPLLDHTGKTMSATQALFTKVFMNMSRPGAPAVHTGQVNFQVQTRGFLVEDFLRTAGAMTAIDTPAFSPAVIPIIQNTGFLSPLIKVIQSIATFFINGLQYLGTVIWTALGSRFPWFTSALGTFGSLVVGFASLLGLIGGYLTNFLTFLIAGFGPVVTILNILGTAWATIQGIYLPIFSGANLSAMITIVVLWVFSGWFIENAEAGNTGAFVQAATLAWRVTNAILLWTWSLAKILIDTIEGLIP